MGQFERDKGKNSNETFYGAINNYFGAINGILIF